MPTTPVRPTNIQLPFANGGLKNTIPVAAAAGALASYAVGFPAVTMQPIAAGGLPPYGKDFNGLLFDITSHTLWVNAGGQYRFDAALSTAMGGYPKGMVLQNTAGTASYVSAVDNNTTDFNSTPSSIGTLWLTYSGASYSKITVPTTGGVVTLTAIQAAAKQIVVTGVLVSNVTLTFPVGIIGEWTVDNSTTGAFNVTAIVSGGSGVTIRQGTADAIYSWGGGMLYSQASAPTAAVNSNSLALANTAYVDRAVGMIGGFYNDTGVVTDAYIVTTIPATGAYTDGQSLRFYTTRANTGACTLNAGGGVRDIRQEDGGPLQAGDIAVGSITTVTYSVPAGNWKVNGTVLSDFLDSPALRGNPTTPTPADGDNDTSIANTEFVNRVIAVAPASATLYLLGLLM
ncbi:MAG: hypothetical protein V4621_07475 [Pseudomonadota bacterium]